MRPASGVFQKRQNTLSARVLDCTKTVVFGILFHLRPQVIAYSHLYLPPLHSVSTATRIGA